MSFWIITDACCDLPGSYIKEQNQFLVVPMSYQIENQVCEIDPHDPHPNETMHTFYQKLINGHMSTTFQVNHQVWVDYMLPICKEGKDILLPIFSSALSGTFASALSAAEELKPQFPELKIYVIDTLCASLGQGLLLHQLLAYRNSGKTIDECAQYATDNIQKTIHWFTVNDLHFLKRGGRVSAASAYLGSILKIKPVLNVSPDGKLILREKVQGRKHSLRLLFEKAKQYAFEPEKQTMFISHGDCLDEAMWLVNKLKTELNVPEILISGIGPIVGSHSGPGTVALFFMGKNGEGRLSASEEK